jgi:BolA protein
MPMSMQQTIEARLNAAFNPQFLEVANESHMHNVAPGSESHFKVTIVSNEFNELMLIKRHRMVNSALETELKKIHALAIHTLTAEEWKLREGNVVDSPPCRGGGKNQ